MKWYSCFEYEPPYCVPLLCRRRNGEYTIDLADSTGWQSNDYTSSADLYITHFAIIEPVEIEE